MKFLLKTYLDDQLITDEVPIEKMNEGSSIEYERQAKLRKNSNKVTKVREIEAELGALQKNSGTGGAHAGVQDTVVRSKI